MYIRLVDVDEADLILVALSEVVADLGSIRLWRAGLPLRRRRPERPSASRLSARLCRTNCTSRQERLLD